MEQGAGERESVYMKRKIRVRDENMPIGKLTVIPNFLPPPEDLVFPKTTKVTINLNKSDVEFFKKKAGKYGNKYQQMIRAVIGQYVLMHSKKS